MNTSRQPNKETSPLSPTRLELSRKFILAEPLHQSPTSAVGTLADDRRFIETLEAFIVKAEARDLANLTLETIGLPEAQRAEQWLWRSPNHWQDVFAVRIRSGFCVQLCSHAEQVAGEIAWRVAFILGDPDPNRTLKFDQPGFLKRARPFLDPHLGSGAAKFAEVWDSMECLIEVRNALVHRQGRLKHRLDNDLAFAAFAAKLDGFEINDSFVALGAGSCAAMLHVVETFEVELARAYEQFREERGHQALGEGTKTASRRDKQ
jgi:hypothetical protein